MTNSTLELDRNKTAKPDPAAGPLGAHPVGTAVGAAAGGAAAGALAGTVAGPVGTVVGAVAGAVAGGLAGNEIAKSIDPTAEEAYWRENYASRPYVTRGQPLTSMVLPIATASTPTDVTKAARSNRRNPS